MTLGNSPRFFLFTLAFLGALSAQAPAQSIDKNVRDRFGEFLQPCLTWIETGHLSALPGSYVQKGRKPTFILPGGRNWSARMEFDTRRKKRECGLTVRGAILDRPGFEAMAQRIMRSITASGQATLLGNRQLRGRTRTLYQIGADRYGVSVPSGGANAWTQVFFTFEKR